MSLAEAATRADELAGRGAEQELGALRAEWADELEAAARSDDYRERAVAYRAIGQLRFAQKTELLRRGLEDTSPACRGSALLSVELLSRDHPGLANGLRPLLHELANADGNAAVRRLAVACLKNASPTQDTLTFLAHLAEEAEEKELRAAAASVHRTLKRKAAAR